LTGDPEGSADAEGAGAREIQVFDFLVKGAHWGGGSTESIKISGTGMSNGGTELSEFTAVDWMGAGTLVRLGREDRVIIGVIVGIIVKETSSEI